MKFEELLLICKKCGSESFFICHDYKGCFQNICTECSCIESAWKTVRFSVDEDDNLKRN
jgi:hypothetical protein